MITILKRVFSVYLLVISLQLSATQVIVQHLTSANYLQVLEHIEKPLIIKVFAPWCGPCTRMKPLFHKFADLYKADYYSAQINIEESPELGDLLKVSALPTIFVIQKKQIIGQVIGAVGTIPALKAKVEKIIVDARAEINL